MAKKKNSNSDSGRSSTSSSSQSGRGNKGGRSNGRGSNAVNGGEEVVLEEDHQGMHQVELADVQVEVEEVEAM